MKTNIYFWSYLAQFFLEWEKFQTKFVEKIKTHMLCSITSPPHPTENRAICDTWSDIYLLQLSFLPVAVVGKLVHK